jgi:hypothetical protein
LVPSARRISAGVVKHHTTNNRMTSQEKNIGTAVRRDAELVGLFTVYPTVDSDKSVRRGRDFHSVEFL